jgi:hypothetical protein
MSKYVPIKKVTNLNTKEFSQSKCKRTVHVELDDIIKRITSLMKKTEKCDIIESKASELISHEKPEKKRRTKVATKNTPKRGENLQKLAGLTRRQMLFQN